MRSTADALAASLSDLFRVEERKPQGFGVYAAATYIYIYKLKNIV